MYCRNCGNLMDDRAVICVKCGVPVGTGTAYCQNCGVETLENAGVCTQCGSILLKPVPTGEQKSKMAAALLGIFLGSLGIHNFYLGNKGKAIAQLLITVCTCGLGSIVSGVWGLIEGILILCGNISTDANGIPLKE